jgi:hypothetical protein
MAFKTQALSDEVDVSLGTKWVGVGNHVQYPTLYNNIENNPDPYAFDVNYPPTPDQ